MNDSTAMCAHQNRQACPGCGNMKCADCGDGCTCSVRGKDTSDIQK